MIQYLDIKTYLLRDILTRVDRASMAHSLEVRVPPLNYKLVDWITTLLDSGHFDHGYLTPLVNKYQSGLSAHSVPLWTLMMYYQFLERYA